MDLVEFARKELTLAGWFGEEGLYGADMGHAVLELVQKFSDQGHSGMSAGICLALFKKVASFEPLTPLTGEEDEWEDITNDFFVAKVLNKGSEENSEADALVDRINLDPGPTGKRYQNLRCFRVFKEDDRVYDSAAILFKNSDGIIVQNSKSRKDIQFPYMPTQEIRPLEEG